MKRSITFQSALRKSSSIDSICKMVRAGLYPMRSEKSAINHRTFQKTMPA
jgi:hypothetical protein